MSTISFLAVLHLELEFDKRSVFEMIQIYLNTEAPFGWSWEGEDPTSWILLSAPSTPIVAIKFLVKWLIGKRSPTNPYLFHLIWYPDLICQYVYLDLSDTFLIFLNWCVNNASVDRQTRYHYCLHISKKNTSGLKKRLGSAGDILHQALLLLKGSELVAAMDGRICTMNPISLDVLMAVYSIRSENFK